MIPAFVGLGSNAGDRAAHLERALTALAGIPSTRLSGVSSLYDTEPVGDPGQPRYLNAVARLFTLLPPGEFAEALREVERRGGRPNSGRGGARTIDLDLLYYGDLVFEGPGLRVPHPWAPDRLFVLVPMAELAPDWVDPAVGIPVTGLLRGRRRLESVRFAGRPRW